MIAQGFFSKLPGNRLAVNCGKPPAEKAITIINASLCESKDRASLEDAENLPDQAM